MTLRAKLPSRPRAIRNAIGLVNAIAARREILKGYLTAFIGAQDLEH
jgi:hypothetical protein